MPNTIVERDARRLIADARAVTPQVNPWSHTEDAEVVAPLLVNFIHAAAELLEYLVDVHGGIDGIQEFRAVLHTAEAIMPQPLTGPLPCECEQCEPGAGVTRSAPAKSFWDALATRRALDAPNVALVTPIPARKAIDGEGTAPLQIVS
ncbi:hypothetical protein SEA_CEN1621_57 [Microbacterium phage Cen1621]|uniref:Uncharacterized protein n=1 Tax=Microbacterium phage Cen1621 TaxID=2965191 RepID=A0A9E7QDH5_9CAUD|nr:hypothetical protein SEA_CEN1621_57 [Microbacterium phage Cen1621]